MQAFPPLVEAFLLIEQPRQRLGHWSQALAALDSAMAPPLASVVAFYDPTCDQAVLNLRYDELALGPAKLGFVVEVALLAEVGMIQPAELSEGERKRFLTERITRCTLQIPYQRSVVGALTELVRRLKEQKGKPDSSPPPNVPLARVEPRGDTGDQPPLVTAKGTRDDLGPPTARVRSTRDLERAPSPPPVPAVPAAPVLPAPGEPIRVTSRHVISRSQRLPTVEMAPEHAMRLATETQIVDVEDPPPPAGAGSGARPAAAPTLPPRPASSGAHPPATSSGAHPPATSSGAHPPANPSGTEPYLPTAASAPPTGVIYARYLRSGRWVPIRVGALSLKGAALMAGALPRLHDHVDVALSYGAHRALVRGEVGKVSTVREAASTGAATFSVSFELDDASRRQLTSLLTAARAAKVTIKPPPARATRRFPVEWPLCLGTSRGALKADALDVSSGGMFVRPPVALVLGTTSNFSIVVDDGGPPIAGRAKVVRQISELEAKACGLAPGFGLGIVEMSETDRMRWTSFLARVERRADRRILVGATPARLAELQGVLAGAGYAVTGGTDPGALVQLANAGPRPVDAAIVDGGWLQNGATASWVESLFTARKVPFLTFQGDPRQVRLAVDRMLDVVM